MQVITIDIKAPRRGNNFAPWLGLNEYTNACRRNKYQGAKLKKLYTEIAYTSALAAMANRREKWIQPTKRVCIACEWIEKDHRRDPDNIASGIKFVLDGIVKAGVIADDSQKYIYGMPLHFLSYRTSQRQPAGVRVQIWEVEE